MQKAYSEPCFVGDAIADPISGLHVALAIQSSLNSGGGAVIDFSMYDVIRYAIGDVPKDLAKTAKVWEALAAQDDGHPYPLRKPLGELKNIGADNAVWL